MWQIRATSTVKYPSIRKRWTERWAETACVDTGPDVGPCTKRPFRCRIRFFVPLPRRLGCLRAPGRKIWLLWPAWITAVSEDLLPCVVSETAPGFHIAAQPGILHAADTIIRQPCISNEYSYHTRQSIRDWKPPPELMDAGHTSGKKFMQIRSLLWN